ncbi:MAG: hypothetical protein IKY62_05925 [Clostridia bacterium]|jgi:hypothetical protein|nr:hypothetical protein [Clostridia bacterium]
MVATGNVVKDFNIGNTRVRICDDYCKGKTAQEVEAILRRIAQMAIGPLTVAANSAYETFKEN